MNDFNLGMNKFPKYQPQGGSLPKSHNAMNASQANGAKFNAPVVGNSPKGGVPNAPMPPVPSRVQMFQMQMNNLASLDRALYVKDLMNLPKDMKELVNALQEALRGATTSEKNTKALNALMMNDISNIIQQGGKDAMSKLILAMSNASKQGITDLSQIKDTMKLINACVSAAGQNNSTATLKSLMMLYLPWLPLDEGVGFDLEVEGGEDGDESKDSSLTVMITTKNYGNVTALLTLVNSNSVSTFIKCCEKFPKEELLKRLKAEQENLSMQSTIGFELVKPKDEPDAKPHAKVNMSQTNQINPYLLLMAHALIRHTIEIDSDMTIRGEEH